MVTAVEGLQVIVVAFAVVRVVVQVVVEVAVVTRLDPEVTSTMSRRSVRLHASMCW
jgi:hypothetical protein